jgi:hypothetical protein
MTTNSPVFVATFDDANKTVTRMTTFCESDKKLDMERGVRLAQHAYHQRTGQRAPALVTAHFERDGQVLAAYNAIELANGGVAPKKGGAPTQAKPNTK